jgi:hypothetical protein
MGPLSSFDGIILFFLALVPLVLLQRALHREIQACFLITTRHETVTIWLFSLLFFPGVMLHETSHFIVANLLRVRTGKFSLLPQAMPDGRLQLGYVETTPTDPVRDSLIGLAPLVAGCSMIALIAAGPMHLGLLWDFLKAGQYELFLQGLTILPTLPDFWVWFYFTFAISSTMMPSASDRHAWLTLGLFAGILLVLVTLAGAGPWMLEHLAPPVSNFFKSVSVILGLSVLIHALLILPVYLLHRLLARLTGLDTA